MSVHFYTGSALLVLLVAASKLKHLDLTQTVLAWLDGFRIRATYGIAREKKTARVYLGYGDTPRQRMCSRNPLPREGLHRYSPFYYNCDVCGEQDNIQGVPGGGTNEGLNASPVVVGAGAWLGRITNYLGITSDGPATESTQLAGRGGCAMILQLN